MFQFARKFIAVLLALWLPFFSGSALAASVSMQFHSGQFHAGQFHSGQAQQMNHEPSYYEDGHDFAMPAMQQAMQEGDSCEQHVGAADAHAQDHHDKKCAACGVCNIACSGYLAVSCLSGLILQQADASLTVYLLSFDSTTSIPLLPPPLARV